MHERSSLRHLIHLATTDGVPRCSASVALVVGTILNLINQGDVLFGIAPISWPKLTLTFLIPYCVSTYGAVAARLRHERRISDGRDLPY